MKARRLYIHKIHSIALYKIIKTVAVDEFHNNNRLVNKEVSDN